MSVTITRREELALLGALEIIRLYQRTVAETIDIMARILKAEADPTYTTGRPYYGILTDEIDDDQRTAAAALHAVLVGFDVTVVPDSSKSEESPEGLGQE